MTRRNRMGRVAGALLIGAALLAGCTRTAPAAAPAASAPEASKDLPVQGDPNLPPAVVASPEAPPRPPKGQTVEVRLTVEKRLLEVAPGWKREVWTYNGQVPGPTIRVNQGDTVKVTLVNADSTTHSVDFHAARISPQVAFKSVDAGKELTFEFKANDPGVFDYHCGTMPMLMHIANGMFGAIIVDPAEDRTPAREYVLVQNEWYRDPMDLKDMEFGHPVAMAFNGIANQYAEKPLQAKVGERVRFYVANPGPNRFSAFHAVGTVFDLVEQDGNPKNRQTGVQTYTVPPGGASLFETTFGEPGKYPVVTHSFADATLGALAVLEVTP
ncbi:MAG: multicopper oxidase domain-containing protein [Bacillota bacterium]